MRTFVLLSVFLACAATSAFAGPEVTGVYWQFSPGLKPAMKPKFSDARSIVLPPNSKLPGRLRAMAVLENKSGKSSGGIVLRVAVSARVVKTGADASTGVWSVPFWLDERRVAELKPGAIKNVAIPNIEVQTYLKRFADTGFWVDALKIQLAVEPRAGEELPLPISEASLEVLKAAAP